MMTSKFKIKMSHTHAPMFCRIKNFIENLKCSSNTGHGREPHLNISNTVTLSSVFNGSIQRSGRKNIRGDRTTERRRDGNQWSQVIPPDRTKSTDQKSPAKINDAERPSCWVESYKNIAITLSATCILHPASEIDQQRRTIPWRSTVQKT